MNRIILMGRLVRDPEVRVTKSEKTVCSFTLAVDRPYVKDKPKETDFINVVVWGKTGSAAGDYLNKGNRVLVEGRLQIRNYIGKDNIKRYVSEVFAEKVEFIEYEKKESTQQQPMTSVDKQAAETRQSAMEQFGRQQPEVEQPELQPYTPDEEIPF